MPAQPASCNVPSNTERPIEWPGKGRYSARRSHETAGVPLAEPAIPAELSGSRVSAHRRTVATESRSRSIRRGHRRSDHHRCRHQVMVAGTICKIWSAQVLGGSSPSSESGQKPSSVAPRCALFGRLKISAHRSARSRTVRNARATSYLLPCASSA